MTNDTIHAAVTTADIAEFLHHLAALRFGAPPADDPAERAAFLARKAELFTRIADQHAPTDPGYAEQVRQMATQAHTAADHHLRLPQQPVGSLCVCQAVAVEGGLDDRRWSASMIRQSRSAILRFRQRRASLRLLPSASLRSR